MGKIKEIFSTLLYFSRPLWFPVLMILAPVVSVIMDIVGTVILIIVLTWILWADPCPYEEIKEAR